jgi:23S rRNA (uracil-5-)-methyltransferase RumA
VLENVFRPPVWKEVLLFFKRIDPALYLNLHTNGFEETRLKAKLAIRENEGLKIGLFKKNSHDVLEILNCPAHHSSINEALERLKKSLSDFHISAYLEKTGQGLLRYAQLAVDKISKKIALVLVLNKNDEQSLKLIKELIASLKKDLWHSIWVNFQTKNSNTIFGEEWLKIWGEDFLWQKLNAVNIAFHPGSFSQANLDLFEKLILEIIKEGKGAKKILELYAGNGAIGLNLADKDKQVTLVEQNPLAKISFEETLKKNSFPNVAYLNEDVNKVKDLIHENDLIIVDPPRKGIDKEILNELENKKEGRLFYISCCFESLQKDILKLLEKGWKIKKAEGYLFFPGTDHIEIFSVLEKKSG